MPVTTEQCTWRHIPEDNESSSKPLLDPQFCKKLRFKNILFTLYWIRTQEWTYRFAIFNLNVRCRCVVRFTTWPLNLPKSSIWYALIEGCMRVTRTEHFFACQQSNPDLHSHSHYIHRLSSAHRDCVNIYQIDVGTVSTCTAQRFLRFAFFWAVTQNIVVVSCRRLQQHIGSIFKGQRSRLSRNTTIRHVITLKSAHLIYFAAKAW
jgi:hypothetical protein